MKKTLFIGSIFLASVLVGCGKYPSKDQARVACVEWMEKGERIDYLDRSNGVLFENYKTNRLCVLEKETSQILGYQGEFDNIDFNDGDEKIFYTPIPSNLKVVKNFYY